jgi:hypothetical protein
MRDRRTRLEVTVRCLCEIGDEASCPNGTLDTFSIALPVSPNLSSDSPLPQVTRVSAAREITSRARLTQPRRRAGEVPWNAQAVDVEPTRLPQASASPAAHGGS